MTGDSGAHIPTPAELAAFWDIQDTNGRPHHRSRCTCPNLDELIINPDEVRDGYVNEDEGIFQ